MNAEVRLSGESPCVFVHGLDGWTNCAIHGWSGDKGQRSRVLICPDSNNRPRLSLTRQPPIAPELWRDAYARIAAQYAVFLERYDLAEDAQAEDIIRAIEARVAELERAAKAVVLAAQKHTPDIIALNRALAARLASQPPQSDR